MIIKWLDRYLLLILTGFLLAFIPLYPKLPLFEAIPGYIVRVRLEDILILLTVGVWFIQAYRGRVRWRTPLVPFFAAYAVVGFLSILSAVFVTQTVPLEPLHVGKTTLHYLRYLEYFALFFIASSAVRSRRDLKILLTIIVVSLVAIFVYGWGQRHLYWPVYSTMNREFSKGVRLYLTEHARVQSTFGGHYDLGAYLVLALPLVATLALTVSKRKYKWGLWLVFLAGLWLMMQSASRVSLFAYIGAIVVVLLGLAWVKHRDWWARSKWLAGRSLVVGLMTMVMLVIFGDGMYERILHTLEAYPAAHQFYLDLEERSIQLVEDDIPMLLGLAQMPKFKTDKPENAISTEEAAVMVSSDERPTTEKPERPERTRPRDVYEDIPDIKKVATVSAEGKTEIREVEVDRVYSEAAMRYGLSAAIRLDTLWPQAWAGFLRNPFLGSGYATLTKESVYHFTEAESTDNNFLRILGETGALGFITFFGIMTAIGYYAWQLLQNPANRKRPEVLAIALGFLAGSIGLLINAIYIDVYAASKVAQTYWALGGLVVATYLVLNDKIKDRSKTP